MFQEPLSEPGSENLWCERCFERFYSAAADRYIGTPCLREGCEGRLLGGAPQQRLRLVEETPPEQGNVA